MNKQPSNPRLAALDDLEKHLTGASAQRTLSRKQKAAIYAKKSKEGTAAPEVEAPDFDDKAKPKAR